jgi:ABC-2 type transport system ATP-binding protein
LKGLTTNEAKSKAKEWFERLEMTGWWDKKVEDLSKGMAQKVQFVTTVLHEPELLIFDEPFTGFDPINTNLIKNEIKRLNENGATVIFSTHRMESVEEICDHIGLIDNGKVMIEGNLLEIRKHYKDGTFAFTTRTSITDWGEHEVLSQKEDPMGYRTILKAVAFPKDLVISLSQKEALVAFEEVLPTVNDIFIEIVKNGPKPWNHE